MKTCTVYVHHNPHTHKQYMCGQPAAYKGKCTLNGETKTEYFCLGHMPGRLTSID